MVQIDARDIAWNCIQLYQPDFPNQRLHGCIGRHTLPPRQHPAFVQPAGIYPIRDTGVGERDSISHRSIGIQCTLLLVQAGEAEHRVWGDCPWVGDLKAGIIAARRVKRHQHCFIVSNRKPAARKGKVQLIDASGNLAIRGARSIAVNAVQRYDDAAYGTDEAASGRPYQIIDQAYLDAKHADSTAFINAALLNDNLLGNKLAGLNNASYADAFRGCERTLAVNEERVQVRIPAGVRDGQTVVLRGQGQRCGARHVPRPCWAPAAL